MSDLLETVKKPQQDTQPPVGMDPYEGWKKLAQATAQKSALDTAMLPTLAARDNATPVAMRMPVSGTVEQQQTLTSALAPTMAAAGGMLKDERTMDVRNARPAQPATPAPAAPAQTTPPITPTVTPPAAASAPAPLAKPSPEQSVQLQALIAQQNNSRAPVSNPYAPVPGSQAAPTAGMPPPGGGGGANLHGTPEQQTAYWAQQKAGLEERGRYADAQEMQRQSHNMMLNDQDLKVKILEDIKANGEKYGPATMQALASLAGHSSGAQAPAAAGVTGLASMANHMGVAAGDAEKNALTARGQDLTYAGHLLTGTNDMAKAQLLSETTRAGHQAQKEIHAGNNESAERRTGVTADAHRDVARMGQDSTLAQLNAWKPSTDPTMSGYAVRSDGKKMRYVEVGMPTPKKKQDEASSAK